MTGEIDANPKVVSPNWTKLSQFFNGTITAYDTTQTPAVVSWTALRKLVGILRSSRKRSSHSSSRSRLHTRPLRFGGQLRIPAAYSKMSISSGLSPEIRKTKDVLSATFTCEGPEVCFEHFSNMRDNGQKLIVISIGKSLRATNVVTL
jgi:hypothetical protein